jgi:hypothetical protein
MREVSKFILTIAIIITVFFSQAFSFYVQDCEDEKATLQDFLQYQGYSVVVTDVRGRNKVKHFITGRNFNLENRELRELRFLVVEEKGKEYLAGIVDERDNIVIDTAGAMKILKKLCEPGALKEIKEEKIDISTWFKNLIRGYADFLSKVDNKVHIPLEAGGIFLLIVFAIIMFTTRMHPFAAMISAVLVCITLEAILVFSIVALPLILLIAVIYFIVKALKKN